MTIEEIRTAKVKAEEEIFIILTELARQTGCRIEEINLTTEEMYGLIPEQITALTIKLSV